MKLIKISSKFQITIPSQYHHLCNTGWFSFFVEDKIITLRPIEINEVKTEQEFLDEFLNK